LAGPSGCGKTTLLLAIVGLLEPHAGEVRIGGEPPTDYVSRGAVGFVGSEAVVFAGTLRSNLVYGSPPGVGDAALREALSLARALDLADESLGGLDRVIGEDGRGLSAGQRQRLALARALVRQPSLLILDEPTANVDVESEAKIASTLRALRGQVTTIVVSHREPLLEQCDLIYDLTSKHLTRRRRAAAVEDERAAE
jgi:subfamily B ATP-binding cassette protein MsbA